MTICKRVAEPKNRTRFCFFWLFALLFWMTVIFLFSARPADVSTEDSHRIGELVVRLVGGGSWTESRRQGFIEGIDFYVRKAAHAMEYAVLAFLFYRTFRGFGAGRRSAVICHRIWKELPVAGPAVYALGAAILYAATDEIHQYFVPGRACRMFDVMVDSCGAVAGIAVTGLACRLRRSRRR